MVTDLFKPGLTGLFYSRRSENSMACVATFYRNAGKGFLDSVATGDWNGGNSGLEYADAYSRKIGQWFQLDIATKSKKRFP